MLTYPVNADSRVPLYEQLYTAIRHDIESGELRPDQKLPSKRALASNLGVSVITVEGALSQLLVEGYLYSSGDLSNRTGQLLPVNRRG